MSHFHFHHFPKISTVKTESCKRSKSKNGKGYIKIKIYIKDQSREEENMRKTRGKRRRHDTLKTRIWVHCIALQKPKGRKYRKMKWKEENGKGELIKLWGCVCVVVAVAFGLLDSRWIGSHSHLYFYTQTDRHLKPPHSFICWWWWWHVILYFHITKRKPSWVLFVISHRNWIALHNSIL